MIKIQINKIITIYKIINHKHTVILKINKNNIRIVIKKIIKIINNLNKGPNFGRKQFQKMKKIKKKRLKNVA